MFCNNCGREMAGNVCFDCPHVALRVGGEAPVYLGSPLSWPELSPRGRRLLRVLTRAPELARQQNLSPEQLRRGLLKLIVKTSTS